MWRMMIFADAEKTTPLKVLTLETIKDVSYILGMKPQRVSNYFHRLIKPREVLEYIALFKH